LTAARVKAARVKAARVKAARVPLTRDLGKHSGPTGVRKRLRPVFVPSHGRVEIDGVLTATESARCRRARLVYELFDAHAATEHLSQTHRSELVWHAHLRYLRDLQWVAREVLADVT
jgi:hypothetical protein